MKIGKFFGVLFTFVAATMMVTTADVYAEEAGSETTVQDASKWQAPQPERKVTSDGIIIDYDLSKLDISMWGFEGTIDVIVTVPENYEKDTIVIAPEAFEVIAKAIDEDVENVYFANSFQPGDKMNINIIINNLSKFTYNYDETSFEIFPKEDIVYAQVTENDPEEKSTLFNDLTVNEHYHFYRSYNTALQALIPGSSNARMTDEVIDSALKAKGYNGIEDYAKYLLDFYNDKYHTDYTRLDQFPDGIVREILGQNDPYYTTNSAYRAAGIYVSTRPNKADVDRQITRAGYSSAEQLILEYYNNKYNSNAEKIVDLPEEALDEFFTSQGIESGGRAIFETNPDVLALSYDYMYNKGLAFGFEDDVVNNDNTEDYSMGAYMRDAAKGDEGVKKNAATLNPNSTGSINNATLYSSGNYILNSYMIYEFMVDLQFSYSALKGTVIAKYVDVDGNVLADDIITKDMVGKDYQTNAQEFNGYSLYTIDGVETGQYINGEIVVIYVYNKVKPAETEEPTVKPMSVVYDNTPVTGDESNIMLWLVIALMSIFGIVTINRTCKEQ